MPQPSTTSTAPHFRRISRAEFAAMWADRSITRREIAASVGLSEKGVSCRAKAYGLALRGLRTKRPSIKDESLFRAMWGAGVGCDDLARYFKVDRRTIDNTRARLELPMRYKGQRPKMTAAQFFMRETAKAEQAQLRLAEMVDAPYFGRRAA